MGAFPTLKARLQILDSMHGAQGLFIHLQSILALALSAVGMNRSAWQITVVEKIINEIGGLLVVDEYDSASGRHGQEQIEQAVSFLWLVNKKDLRRISC